MVDQATTFCGKGHCVLLIDDDLFSRKLTRGALERLGFCDIREAASGQEGLALIGEKSPDLVILDWVMPGGLSGIEFLGQLRSPTHPARDVPVVVTSESAGRDTIVETARAGASAVVIKPFAKSTLAARITRALGPTTAQPTSAAGPDAPSHRRHA